MTLPVCLTRTTIAVATAALALAGCVTSNFEGVFIPSNWSGKYPGGIGINGSTNTFLSIRPWYIGDPAWSKVQGYLNGGSAPTFNYHRFWAEVDVATAFDTFAMLFPNTSPPSGF